MTTLAFSLRRLRHPIQEVQLELLELPPTDEVIRVAVLLEELLGYLKPENKKLNSVHSAMLQSVARPPRVREPRPLIEPARAPSERVQHSPREPRPRAQRPPKETVVTEPWGFYGRWDYPNQDWDPKPTVLDIPEIMEQKQRRFPTADLWKSEERMRQWFISKGFISSTIEDTQ